MNIRPQLLTLIALMLEERDRFVLDDDYNAVPREDEPDILTEESGPV